MAQPMIAMATEPRDTVLLVDDCEAICRAAGRILRARGYQVLIANDVSQAEALLADHEVNVVVSDVHMPGQDGIALLRAVHERDPELPVILLTGAPDIRSAMEAVRLGAFRYLTKPFDRKELGELVDQAAQLYRLSRIQREVLAMRGVHWTSTADVGLADAFERCLAGLWMAFQPIVRAADGAIFGYEALLRSDEPRLPHPGAVLDAAERLGRIHDLGWRTRELAASAARPAPERGLLFVNLHPRDLMDEALLDTGSVLSGMADRVVLEVTERQLLDDATDVAQRVARLREFGFRIAIDDLGAGYASLNAFATLSPDFVKLDIGLVRDVHIDALKQRLIGSMVRVCHETGMMVVAEGVETLLEREKLRELGCDLLQGFLIARPARPFPEPEWHPCPAAAGHDDGRRHDSRVIAAQSAGASHPRQS